MSYQLSINNKIVFDYYNNNKNVSFEEMSCFMVDILNKISKKTDVSLDSTLAEKILASIINLDSKIENNISEVFELKFEDFKKNYTLELNNILTSNNNDKIGSILKEYNDSLQDKTKLLFNEYFPKNNEIITSHINQSFTMFDTLINSSEARLNNTLDSKLSNLSVITNTQNSIATNINLLINKFHGSSTKGNFSEVTLVDGLTKIFPYGNVDHVGNKLNNSGDIILNRKEKSKIIIENKEYEKTIPPPEIQKFVENIIMNNCDGIMISQHTQITSKDDFEININGKSILIYICNMEYNMDKVRTAISIIDHLKTQTNFINKEKTTISFTIEEIDIINAEYNLLIGQKKNIIKSLNISFNKIIKEVENIKIPYLEDILIKQYGVKLSDEIDCIYCNKTCKNEAGISAHLKTCNNFKKTEDFKKLTDKKEKVLDCK